MTIALSDLCQIFLKEFSELQPELSASFPVRGRCR